MAYAKVASAAAASTSGSSVTTSAVDTTGATTLIAAIFDEGGSGSVTMEDSKGNTWTPLTAQQSGTAKKVQLFYVNSATPTVGSGHTASATFSGAPNRFPAIWFFAASGGAAAPFDQQNGANQASGATLAPGSVTPSENNELVVVAVNIASSGETASFDGGFTEDADIGESAKGDSVHAAYLIQTTAAAANPTCTASSGNCRAAVIATFKAAAGGGGGNDFLLVAN